MVRIPAPSDDRRWGRRYCRPSSWKPIAAAVAGASADAAAAAAAAAVVVAAGAADRAPDAKSAAAGSGGGAGCPDWSAGCAKTKNRFYGSLFHQTE